MGNSFESVGSLARTENGLGV